MLAELRPVPGAPARCRAAARVAWAPPAQRFLVLLRGAALAELRPAQLREVARRTLGPSRGLVLVMGDLDDVGGMWVVRTADGFALRDRPD